MGEDYAAPGVPPAWHPDPQDSSRQRWWDGTEWTENVRAANQLPAIANPNLIGETAPLDPEIANSPPAPVAEAPSSFSDDPFATAKKANPFPPTPSPESVPIPTGIGSFHSSESASSWDSHSPAGGALAEPSGYVPMSRIGSPAVMHHTATSASLGLTFTPALWVIAFLPILHGAIVYFVLGAFSDDGIVALSNIESTAIVLVPLILYPIFALWDAGSLSRRGLPRPPPAILALIPPLYLLVRTLRAAGSSMLMLALWTAIQAVVIGIVLTQMSITLFDTQYSLQPAPTATSTGDGSAVAAAEFEAPFTAEKRAFILSPEGMALKLMHDYGAAGLLVDDLVCQPLESTAPSSQTTCIGTLIGVELVVTVVVGSDTDESVSPVFIAG